MRRAPRRARPTVAELRLVLDFATPPERADPERLALWSHAPHAHAEPFTEPLDEPSVEPSGELPSGSPAPGGSP